MAKIEIEAGQKACIEEAKVLAGKLMEAFKRAQSGDTIVLNLDQTRRTDTSLGQLILAAESEARQRQLVWQVRDKRGDKQLADLLSCDFSCSSCTVRDIHAKAATRRQS